LAQSATGEGVVYTRRGRSVCGRETSNSSKDYFVLYVLNIIFIEDVFYFICIDNVLTIFNIFYLFIIYLSLTCPFNINA